MAAPRGGGRDARLASIRSCNRHDFLHAFALRTRPTPGAARKHRPLRASSGSVRGRQPTRASGPMRASADTIRNVRGKKVDGEDEEDLPIESDGEDDVPPYLNEARLDALDMLHDLPELRALVRWMRSLRREHGCRLAESDVDLTNGVALLETLYIVQPELFDADGVEDGVNELEQALSGLSMQGKGKPKGDEEEEEEAGFDPASPPPSRPASTIVVAVPLLPRKASGAVSFSVEKACGVIKDLDEEGRAAAHNLDALTEKMNEFHFHDWEEDGRYLGSASFGSVEAWQLAGYILLIALNGKRRERHVAELLEWDKETRDVLDGVYRSALESFNMRLPPSSLEEQLDDDMESDEQPEEEFDDEDYAEYAQGEIVGEEYLPDEEYDEQVEAEAEVDAEIEVELGAEEDVEMETDAHAFEDEEVAEEEYDSLSNDPKSEVLALPPPETDSDKPASDVAATAAGGAKRYRPPQRVVRRRKSMSDKYTQTGPYPISDVTRQTQTIPPRPKIVLSAATQTDPELDKEGHARRTKEIEILTKCANRNEELVRSERAVRKGLEGKVALLEEEKKISAQHIQRQDVLTSKLSQQLEEHRSENKKLRDEVNKLKAEVVSSKERERIAARMLKKAQAGLVEAHAEPDVKRALPKTKSQRLLGAVGPVAFKETRATRAAAATAVQRHKAEAAALRRKLADAERKLQLKEKNEERLHREFEKKAKTGNSFGRRFFKRTEPVK